LQGVFERQGECGQAGANLVQRIDNWRPSARMSFMGEQIAPRTAGGLNEIHALSQDSAMIRKLDRQILFDAAKRLWRNRAARRRTGLYPLEHIILYVTMRCNARCEHCFCADSLNKGLPEPSLEQIERIAETIPPLRHLSLTGGEPTLRADLAAIIRAFARRGKVDTFCVCTNGLKPARIEELAVEIKSEFPDRGLLFQVSIDGLEATHDAVRGVPGNFQKAIESLRAIQRLRGRFRNLAAGVLTVVMDRNHGELVALNDFLRREVADDLPHGFELVRDVSKTAWNIPPEVAESGGAPGALRLPPREAFGQIAADLETIHRRSPSHHANSFHVHNLAQLRMVATGRPQYPCVTAGQSVGVIYSTGEVAHCEFTKPFAGLADFDYDFQALWNSEAAQRRRAQIRGCYCTHGCFHGKAVEYSWRGLWEMTRAATRR